MTTAAISMMIVYLFIVWGGLAFGAIMMATHRDETAGLLGDEDAHTSATVPDDSTVHH